METVQLAPPETLGFRTSLDTGCALLDAERTGDGIPYLEHAVRLRATSFGSVRLGGAYRQMGRLDEARSMYEEALTIEGRGKPDVRARTGLAAVLCDYGDVASLVNAVDLLGTVVEAEPANVGAWASLGRAYEQAYRKSGYEEFAQKAAHARQMARASDPRSEQERREEQRLRAVKARSAAAVAVVAENPQTLEKESVAPPTPETDTPPNAEATKPERTATRRGWFARLVRRALRRDARSSPTSR